MSLITLLAKLTGFQVEPARPERWDGAARGVEPCLFGQQSLHIPHDSHLLGSESRLAAKVWGHVLRCKSYHNRDARAK